VTVHVVAALVVEEVPPLNVVIRTVNTVSLPVGGAAAQ
jgi:hypothetical protein